MSELVLRENGKAGTPSPRFLFFDFCATVSLITPERQGGSQRVYRSLACTPAGWLCPTNPAGWMERESAVCAKTHSITSDLCPASPLLAACEFPFPLSLWYFTQPREGQVNEENNNNSNNNKTQELDFINEEENAFFTKAGTK